MSEDIPRPRVAEAREQFRSVRVDVLKDLAQHAADMAAVADLLSQDEDWRRGGALNLLSRSAMRLSDQIESLGD